MTVPNVQNVIAKAKESHQHLDLKLLVSLQLMDILTQIDKKGISIMGFILGIIFISALYVGEGALLSYMKFKKEANEYDEFKFNWSEILTWPKVLF